MTGGILEAVTVGGYTIGFGVQLGAGALLINDGLARTTFEAKDLSFNPNPKFNFDSIFKSGSIDPKLPASPDDILKRPDWKETTHPDAGKKGHRTFENGKTGEKLRHDEGKPGLTGHKARDHYHHLVPDGKGGYNYVDGKGNPVPSGCDQAHLYPDISK